MNYETLLHKLREDPASLAGLDTDTLEADCELTEAEWLGLEMLVKALELVEVEAELLAEQFSDDKEVRYILEVFDIEGAYYTLVHKLDVGGYLGYKSTMAGLAKTLKAVEILLDDLMYPAE